MQGSWAEDEKSAGAGAGKGRGRAEEGPALATTLSAAR